MMARHILSNMHLLPAIKVQADESNTSNYSFETSIAGQPTMTQSNIPIKDELLDEDSKSIGYDSSENSDSSSTASAYISAEESDTSSSYSCRTEKSNNDNTEKVSRVNKTHFNFRRKKTEAKLSEENDETTLLTRIPMEKTTQFNSNNEENTKDKPMKKRHRIRLAIEKKINLSRSRRDSSGTNVEESDTEFAKTLLKIQDDVQKLVIGISQIDQAMTDNSTSNTSAYMHTILDQSQTEQERAKLEIIRMAFLLAPPNILTYETRDVPYAYTDIVKTHIGYTNQAKHKFLTEDLLVQHKPFRHKKFRYRTQRTLLGIRKDLKQLNRDLYGKGSLKSHKELSSHAVQNYRNRLTKNLLEVRRQMAEYDRIHSSKTTYGQTITQIMERMETTDPNIKAQIEYCQNRLSKAEYVQRKRKYQLISAPFIPRRAHYVDSNVRKNNNNFPPDPRFDPSTFMDLNLEAEIFFGADKPFWEQSTDSKPLSESSSLTTQLNQPTLSSQPVVQNNSMIISEVKLLNLKDIQFKETEIHSDDSLNKAVTDVDEFFDCTSSLDRTNTLSFTF